tara:strand:- start:3429 stop:3929 length:501 start_codon:yes stop_codon:yes gene_type:complete
MIFLDILPDDIIDKIFGYTIDSVEKDFKLTTSKVTNLNRKLKYLYIDGSFIDNYNPNHILIHYDNITYSMDSYLFDNLNIDSTIIFVDNWSNYFGAIDGFNYISKKYKNATYLDVIIEANNAVKTTGDYHHIFLEGIYEMFPDKVKSYMGFKPEKNIRYIGFCLRS